jgi:hypothetical protein
MRERDGRLPVAFHLIHLGVLPRSLVEVLLETLVLVGR